MLPTAAAMACKPCTVQHINTELFPDHSLNVSPEDRRWHDNPRTNRWSCQPSDIRIIQVAADLWVGVVTILREREDNMKKEHASRCALVATRRKVRTESGWFSGSDPLSCSACVSWGGGGRGQPEKPMSFHLKDLYLSIGSFQLKGLHAMHIS